MHRVGKLTLLLSSVYIDLAMTGIKLEPIEIQILSGRSSSCIREGISFVLPHMFTDRSPDWDTSVRLRLRFLASSTAVHTGGYYSFSQSRNSLSLEILHFRDIHCEPAPSSGGPAYLESNLVLHGYMRMRAFRSESSGASACIMQERP